MAPPTSWARENFAHSEQLATAADAEAQAKGLTAILILKGLPHHLYTNGCDVNAVFSTFPAGIMDCRFLTNCIPFGRKIMLPRNASDAALVRVRYCRSRRIRKLPGLFSPATNMLDGHMVPEDSRLQIGWVDNCKWQDDGKIKG